MPVQPSDNEQEYFLRQELNRLKRARETELGKTAADERERLKQLHWMRCPKCGTELNEIDFRGIEVDACLGCGGMFFDQGEIDKLTDGEHEGWLGRIRSTILGA